MRFSKPLTGIMAAAVTTLTLVGPLSSSASATTTASSTQAVAAVGVDEVCAVLGIGSGAAGLTKALAKGGSWVGIGAAVGCYAWVKAEQVTPAEKRAYQRAAYDRYRAMSATQRLKALGYDCYKYNPGGGGGTDSVPNTTASTQGLGYRFIKMQGVTYRCSSGD